MGFAGVAKALTLPHSLLRRAGFGLAVTLTFMASPVAAQITAEDALADFDFVTGIVEHDYAGYSTKTEGDKTAEFAAEKAKRRAAVAQDPASAPYQIRMMLGWFRDRHLGLSGPPSPPPGSASAAVPLALGSRLEVDEALARAAHEAAPGSLAGIWSSADGNYRLALVPSLAAPGKLDAVILSTRSSTWKAGEIKARIDPAGPADWYMGDHSKMAGTAYSSPDVISLPEAGITLLRDYPQSRIDPARVIPAKEFFLRRLSPETLWLRLPDFAAGHRAEIEALLDANDALLRSTPNLLIDLRDNSGGSDASYRKLMSYIYTRPIYSIGAEILNTPRNQSYFAEGAANRDLPEDTRAFLADVVDRMRRSQDEWIPLFPRGFAIETLPEIMPFPRNVGILAEGAGSSGDQFVIDSRFSSKVTILGGPTAGVIDYSNVNEASLPTQSEFTFRWPTTRSQRLPEEPLDNIGVQPDVPFGPEVIDPVGKAMEWLESHPR